MPPSPMPTTVVEADLHAPAHAQALLGLMDEYARGDTGGGQGLADFVQQNLVRELLARPQIHVLLAYHRPSEISGSAQAAAAAAVGLAICMEGFSTFACQPLLNIHDLVVTAQARGRGVGRALLAHAEQLARRLGCCKLTLEVLTGNTGAQALYRSCGYAAYMLDPAMGSAQFWQKKLGE